MTRSIRSAATRGLSRRQILRGGLGGALAVPLAVALPKTLDARPSLRLRPRPAEVSLYGDAYPATRVWSYGASLPGPLIRAKQGERVRIDVQNELPVATTVHWHGLRVPNAMDGVPELTQDPIQPGSDFTYEFDLPDAGTYWYHPHLGSAEQLGRGLYGGIIVEEPEPPEVDRDLLWILDDWRLDQQAQIIEDFGNWHDLSHNGRLGNSVTVNGRDPGDVMVRAGERLRLRLVNAANARVFALDFEGHAPWIIALDGQPVAPHAPSDGRVVLAPSQRADLILDMTAEPGTRHRVIDAAYRQDRYLLLDLVYADEALRAEAPAERPESLPANPLPEPDLDTAERHRIHFGGGMMDPALRRGEMDIESARERFGRGEVWRINGEARLGHGGVPLLTLARDRSFRLELVNDTVWDHPIHLHGHSFRVLTLNDQEQSARPWRDTLLMAPGDTAEIAFVADNPGDWMFHCHIPEHQESGMMATIRVL